MATPSSFDFERELRELREDVPPPMEGDEDYITPVPRGKLGKRLSSR
jgi:hypothetical protein